MDDLSHWDFAPDFTAHEAATLIIGDNPTSLTNAKVKPVLARMQRDYESLKDWFKSQLDVCFQLTSDAKVPDARRKLYSKAESKLWEKEQIELLRQRRTEQPLIWLESVRMAYAWVYGASQDASVGALLYAILDKKKSEFGAQRFSREEVSRWLTAIGMKSVYQFDRIQPQPIEQASGRWPWGDHHTELLGHLEATARRYWQNYDPTDATTAPTNKDVAEWLVNERKLSQKTAESIASMLRPDGLPTGPRK